VSEWEKKVLAKGWGGRVAMGGVEWARIGGVRILTGRMITLQINEMRVTFFFAQKTKSPNPALFHLHSARQLSSVFSLTRLRGLDDGFSYALLPADKGPACFDPGFFAPVLQPSPKEIQAVRRREGRRR